jgi:hypothetical protein
MKRNLNEQITRIKNMMGLNEHMEFDTPNEDGDDYYEDKFGKFDPDYFEDSEEGFGDKMNQKIVSKKIKMDPQGLSPLHASNSRKKDREIPRDEYGKEIKWSPIQKNDMSLSDYLKSPEHEKRMSKKISKRK